MHAEFDAPSPPLAAHVLLVPGSLLETESLGTRLPYPMCGTESDPCKGWFGSETETSVIPDECINFTAGDLLWPYWLHPLCVYAKRRKPVSVWRRRWDSESVG